MCIHRSQCKETNLLCLFISYGHWSKQNFVLVSLDVSLVYALLDSIDPITCYSCKCCDIATHASDSPECPNRDGTGSLMITLGTSVNNQPFSHHESLCTCVSGAIELDLHLSKLDTL